MKLTTIGVISSILITVIPFGCIKKVERQVEVDFGRYFPLREGGERLYSGFLGKSTVTGRMSDIYTIAHYDSAGNVFWWEDFYRNGGNIFLKNIISGSPGFPSVHFEPALPFAPWSDVVGDTLLFSSGEIRDDSVNTHTRVLVGYGIEAIEPVQTPAGNFDNCIKIKISYSTTDNSVSRIFDGDSFWWFAEDVGFVKYESPAGSGELLEAMIKGVKYP